MEDLNKVLDILQKKKKQALISNNDKEVIKLTKEIEAILTKIKNK